MTAKQAMLAIFRLLHCLLTIHKFHLEDYCNLKTRNRSSLMNNLFDIYQCMQLR